MFWCHSIDLKLLPLTERIYLIFNFVLSRIFRFSRFNVEVEFFIEVHYSAGTVVCSNIGQCALKNIHKEWEREGLLYIKCAEICLYVDGEIVDSLYVFTLLSETLLGRVVQTKALLPI
jgi:hypothetical protein